MKIILWVTDWRCDIKWNIKIIKALSLSIMLLFFAINNAQAAKMYVIAKRGTMGAPILGEKAKIYAWKSLSSIITRIRSHNQHDLYVITGTKEDLDMIAKQKEVIVIGDVKSYKKDESGKNIAGTLSDPTVTNKQVDILREALKNVSNRKMAIKEGSTDDTVQSILKVINPKINLPRMVIADPDEKNMAKARVQKTDTGIDIKKDGGK